MKKEINSSNIEAVNWENNFLTLFFRNGVVIRYRDVPKNVYEELCSAHSAGSYLKFHVCGVFSYQRIEVQSIEERIKRLEHHKDSTVGLWATDRPDLIPENIKDLFFEIRE